MKSKLSFFFLVLTQVLFAQNFTEVPQLVPFDGIMYSSIAFADVNGDGSQDLLLTGATDFSGDAPISKLYTNDGTGNFTEITGTPFEGVWYGSMGFSDVNGDGTEDVFITGGTNILGDALISKLYTNDGTGNFTEMTGTPFDGVMFSSMAFSDVNGDGSEDILITGQDSSFDLISKLYINDGTGNFTEMTGTPFAKVMFSAIAFSDVNGDGTEDVFITGQNSSFDPISKLYTNDGTGNFTEMTDAPFDAVSYGSIAFSDVNGDGSEDVLITGKNSSFNRISKLYTNDGTGNFTEMTDAPFDGVLYSAVAFSDVNGDGSQDVLITGENNMNIQMSKLYTNDGTGNFTEITNTPFDVLRYGSIAFSDVNGDGSEDLFLTGQNLSLELISKLYTTDKMTASSDVLLIDARLQLTPFPNPVNSHILKVSFKSRESNSITVRVYDLQGKQVGHRTEWVETGEQTLEVDITSLPSGNYFIRLENGETLGTAEFIIP